MKRPNILVPALLLPLLVVFCLPAWGQGLGDKKHGIKIIHPDAKDAKSFIRSHRVVIGAWDTRMKCVEDGVIHGWLHYPVYNDDPMKTFMGEFKIIKPTDKRAAEILADEDKVGDTVLLIQSKDKPGLWEVAGVAAPLPKEPGDNWLPTSRSLDYELFKRSEYRYAGLIDESIGQLEDKNPKVRTKAMGLLAAIGPDAAKALGAVVKLLDSEARSDRAGAIDAISRIGGEDAEHHIPRIIELLKDDPALTHVSIRALARFGHQAAPATPAIIDALHAADQTKASSINYIIEALGTIAPGDPKVVEALTPYLKHQYETTRSSAKKALDGAFLKKPEPKKPIREIG